MANSANISPALFQEFLEQMAGADELAPEKKRQLLTSFAEVKFRLRGGSRCPMCKTPVRHVMPIYTVHLDGTERSYPCLCTRCFEGEKGLSSKIVVRMGATSLVYDRGARGEFDMSVMTNVQRAG